MAYALLTAFLACLVSGWEFSGVLAGSVRGEVVMELTMSFWAACCLAMAISIGGAQAGLTDVEVMPNRVGNVEADAGPEVQKDAAAVASTDVVEADETDAANSGDETGADAVQEPKTVDSEMAREASDEYTPAENNTRLSINSLNGRVELPSDYYGGYIDLLSPDGNDFVQADMADIFPRQRNVGRPLAGPARFEGLPTARELLDFSGRAGRNVCNTLTCLRASLTQAGNAAMDFGEPMKTSGPSQSGNFSSHHNSSSASSSTGASMSQYRSRSEILIWIVSIKRWLWDAIRNPIVIVLVIMGYACAVFVSISRRQHGAL